MNKHTYSSVTISALVALASVFPAITSAQEEVLASPTVEKRKEEVQQRTQERKANVREKRGDVLERKEKTQERAAEMKASVEKRREQLTEKKAEVERRIAERRANEREKRDELMKRKDDVQKRWEERKAKLLEKHKEIIARHVDKMTKRTQAVIERLDNLANKIEERINILIEREIDVSAQKANPERARAAIVDAQAALDNAIAAFKAAPQTDNPGEAYAHARIIFEDVKAATKEAHRLLIDTVISVK